jgi:hypothetical protein
VHQENFNFIINIPAPNNSTGGDNCWNHHPRARYQSIAEA